MALKFHYTWVHILTSLSSILGVPYIRDDHTKILQWQNFFHWRGECRKIFYIIQSYGPHGGWNKVIITGMLSWCYQRHYLGSYGPFTRTLWWFTEGRSLQHLFRNTTFLLQDIWVPSVVKDNMLSSSVFSPAVKAAGSCQEKWY